MSLLQHGSDGDFVTRSWIGKAAIVIATGPSLTHEQCEVARRLREADVARVIAVNDALYMAPFADVHYFPDRKWWQDFGHRDRPEFRAFKGQRCSMLMPSGGVESNHESGAVYLLRIGKADGWSWRPHTLNTGVNSGHQAINLAALSGGNPVIALGLDGRGQHFFGNHPDNSVVPHAEMRQNLTAGAAELAERGIRVINCSPGSAIDCFERGTIEEIGLLLAA